jgi:hypothetical protein
MSKALSKTTPIRSRRAVLAGIASAAALPLTSAFPTTANATSDPIFAAIEAHRKAYATMQAAFAEHRKAHEIADSQVGPAHIYVPSMVDPGGTVEASCWIDIGRAVPREQYPDLYAHYDGLLSAQKAAHAVVVESLIGDEDEDTEEFARPELETLRQFEATVPTTLAGLLAMLIYAGEITQRDPEAFADRDSSLIETLATAAKEIANEKEA